MARYDVYPGSRGLGYLLDCQSELLGDLVTRVVVPLMPAKGFEPVPRLNPAFAINGEELIMATQLIFAIPRDRLQPPIANLESEHFTIVGALDVLVTGY